MRRLLRFVRSHRSVAATGLVAVVVTAVVATIGVTSTGYQAQRLDLSDGTVWVANDSASAIGRANPAVLELNSALRGAGADLSVVQDSQHVLLLDSGNATVGQVDTATATVPKTVPLPPNEPGVLLAGSTAVVLSGKTGQFWSMPVSALDSYDASSQAELTLGADSVAAVSPAGTMVAYSAQSGKVTRIDDIASFGVSASASLALPKTDTFQVASVGQHWAVLDTTSAVLVVDGRRIDLSGRVTGRLALQQSTDAGSSFQVASEAGLVEVSVAGGVSVRVQGRQGSPARPVVASGCTYAAWSDGVAWNDCQSRTGSTQTLKGMSGGATLVLAQNGGKVVLNDTGGGHAWAVQRSGQLMDNWSDLLTDPKDTQQHETQTPTDQQQLEQQQKPPVAVDDSLGARPGRSTLLPVLLNDYDPNGDPLVITQVSGLDSQAAKLDIVSNGQQVLITLSEAAAGTVGFDYTISDGRGGTDSAHVTVAVKQADENSPPQQMRATRAVVASSGRVTIDALNDWVDPDGDPMYVTGATGGDGGTVTYEPTGQVVYQDAGRGPSTQEISVGVSDGRMAARGTIQITVDAAGETPLTASSFTVMAYRDQVTTVSPLAYTHGGTGVIKLNGVPAKAGSTVAPSYATGTFAFVSHDLGTHLIEYTVTDGDKTATGTVRIDVQTAPSASTPPITTPKTVFVETLGTRTVDVTATDFDPAGNVLMVSGTGTLPRASGVQVETIEQRYLKVTLTAPLDAPVSFTYTITNGLASSQGSVTVVQIPRPSRLQPPIATNDQATARVGDSVDIDVLANDEQPDGETVSLEPKLVSNVPSGGGLLFVAGDRLRYLAPKTPGNYTAVYAIDGPDGQRATAQVAIAVREADTATDNAPVPQTLTARVVAGQTVRIQVPLDTIDPDGDSVQLIGIDSNPQKGDVARVGAAYVDYEAGTYSAGTDTFTYTVVDSLGLRATGTIRVGIAPKAQGSRNPIAVADAVTMRPGGSILVRVLANDTDPDGGSLRVTGVRANDADVTAEVLAGGIVRITPPREAKTYGLVYTIANSVGGTSSNFITVKVDPKAELTYPEADDSVLGLADVRQRKTVDVNVLANVFFADGNVANLGLGLVAGYGTTAEVTDRHRIRVTLTASSQIIPFYVSNPADPSIRAYAFIKIPGSTEAVPQLDPTAPALTVVSGSRLTIDLDRYVVTAGTNGVRITDDSTVRATHSNGADLVVDSHTLAFTSAPDFFGAASISFQVTDGTSASDPDGHKATLVLAIRVTPKANQPPVFSGAAVDLEPGGSRSLDLSRLTTYPSADLSSVRYALTTASVPGFTIALSGTELTVSAASSTAKGTTARVGVSVRDEVTQGQAGIVSLTVVGSTRPLVVASSDTAVVRRGTTTTLDVLANDQAANPFPGQALRVVAIRGLGGSSLPAGLSVTPSADRSKLTIAVAAGAKAGNTNLQYEVADATGDPSRYVWGTVSISVQDVPDAPSAPIRSGSFVGGSLTLGWAAASANDSPITDYRLTGTSSVGAYTKDCGLSTLCTLTDLVPGARYTFTVTAVNALGASRPSAQSVSYSSDFIPAAPANLQVVPSTSTPGSLVITWNAVPTPSRGTPVTGYVVEIAGVGAQSVQGTTATVSNLALDTVYSAQVYATNSAPVASTADWARSGIQSARTIGAPGSPGPVTATVAASGSGNVAVAHAASDPNGASGVTYSYGRVDGVASVAPACSAGGTKPDAITLADGVDTTAADGKTYTYFVYADNGYFCTSAKSSGIQSLKAPTGVIASLAVQDSGNGYFDVVVTALSVDSGSTAGGYFVTDASGNRQAVSVGAQLTSSADTSVYGTQQRYTVVACRTSDGDYCSSTPAAVKATPVATRPTITVCSVGSTVQFSPPTNGSAVSAVSYSVQFADAGGTWSGTDDTGAAYSTASVVPDGTTAVRLKGTVTTADGTYTDPSWAVLACQTPATDPGGDPTPPAP